MKLSTKLRLNASLLIALAILISFGAFASYKNVIDAFAKSARVDLIRIEAFELNSLTLDFLLSRTERAKVQWLAKHEEMAQGWNSGQFSLKSEQALLAKIRRNHSDLMTIFPMIAQRLEGAYGQELSEDEFVSRFSSQILLKTRVIVSAAEQLEAMTKIRVVKDLKKAGWIIFFLNGAALFMVALISLGIQQSMLQPLVRLHQAAVRISSGDWAARTGVQSDDEMGEVSAAFDDMVENLARTTVSRDRLLAEIDSHQRTFSALRESEEKLRSIMAAAKDAIIMMDEEEIVTFWNPAAETIFGYEAGAIIGQNLHETLSPHYGEVDAENIRAFVRTGNGKIPGQSIEVTALRKGGETFPAEISLSRARIEGRWNAVVILRDITEKKGVEARLRQSEKMESIGHLAGGIAHDFNNILYAAMGYTELSQDIIEEGSPAKKYLKEVYESLERAKHLVQQILTFARKGEEKVQPVPVAGIVREALNLIRSTVPTTIEIRQEIDSKKSVMADPTQLHQVVINLCANGAHAMEEEGGILTVQVEETYLDFEMAKGFTDLNPGDYLVLKVSDTGMGIEPDLLDSIFDPFFTTKETGKGTGLGLSVVHGIVRSCCGDIRVKSRVGRGTDFSVYLPLIDSQKEARAHEAEAEVSLPRGEERILVIDDEPPIARMVGKMLTRLGYTVFTLTSSTEALKRFKAAPEAFDLVITDMTMPAMAGDRLAREMIRIRPDLPVILCTGYHNRISDESVQKSGIAAFVMKPVGKQELAEAVRRALDREDPPRLLGETAVVK